ncbi:NAD-dependent epimerase/dehydratase family protein [Roseococcus sp. SYP-B2431]|uniref:NAD-dependent epimerase/dehydratase family protein n=1 Tax=Roseococcus sp. SYP-B2431 TaxID=2496640 RepID=UPI00103B87A5|nr:NAD-dependent epimerase/dehydratase family protein [Roseococcus sp. SYP-B2431]TCH96298.1 NAD-dependent epimerase/dehydratase family protein [Roseococcus sp. SYP-B2431]
MARLLVTGGCGFIGSHLCEALIAQGHGVRVLDNLSTGSLANLVPGATLVIGSVENADDVARAMDGMDGCFHLAAVASVQRCTDAWLASHHANLSGTIAVLAGARDASKERGRPVPVVYASSAAVYGVPAALPIEESAAPGPLSAYGADKLGCELHARVAGQVHGVPTLGLRFFNVFGPRQDPSSPYSGVISIFCERLLHGDAVVIHGDGGQTRDFVFVGDVVTALIAGMGAASTLAPVFNVCTGRPTSVLKLAHLIASACGTRAAVEYQPARLGDIRNSVGSPRLARKALALPSPMALEAGLARVLDWTRAGSPALASIDLAGLAVGLPARSGRAVQNA